MHGAVYCQRFALLQDRLWRIDVGVDGLWDWDGKGECGGGEERGWWCDLWKQYVEKSPSLLIHHWFVQKTNPEINILSQYYSELNLVAIVPSQQTKTLQLHKGKKCSSNFSKQLVQHFLMCSPAKRSHSETKSPVFTSLSPYYNKLWLHLHTPVASPPESCKVTKAYVIIWEWIIVSDSRCNTLATKLVDYAA